MNYLITGGCGFVGSNLVRQLQRDNPDANILVIDDFRSGSFLNLAGPFPGIKATGENAQWQFRGNVMGRPLGELNLYAVTDEFKPDVIFHLASITDTTVTDQAKMIADNVEPFEVLLDIAVEARIPLVWASSGATYGTHANGATAAKRPFKIEDAGQPANVYGFSKWVMENLHREAAQKNPDAKLVGLRYFNVFGPGELHKGKMASMIFQLAQQMIAGKTPRIFFDGSQSRDHVYVQDVVEATIAGSKPTAKTGIYNVGSGVVTSFNQIIAANNEALGTSLKTEYFENPYAFYQDYTCADLSLSKSGLQWSPRFTPVPTMVEYVRSMQ